MLQNINKEIKTWDWKSQTVGQGENQVQISTLIARIERENYKTKEIKYNIENFNLSGDSFSCGDLFEFLTHVRLMQSSDLKHPIIVNKKGQVIDGRHRICKAILEGKKEIDGIMILDDEVI